jgi:hypothetical protein
MTKTLVRFYDREDNTSLVGNCYFLISDKTKEELMNSYELEDMMIAATSMRWQKYTSYAIGVIDDLEEDEMFWSEIMNYNMKECEVHVNRVHDIEKYKLPEMYAYNEEY